MRHQAAKLVVRRRKIRHEVLVSDLLKDECENPGDLFDIVAHDHVLDKLDLSLDVRRVLDQLPGHLRTLAYLLPVMPITQICIVVGKSRTRIYQMIRQIRAAFIQAGLGRARRAVSESPNRRSPPAPRIGKANRRGIARTPGSRGTESLTCEDLSAQSARLVSIS
jgi:hypothetical protein